MGKVWVLMVLLLGLCLFGITAYLRSDDTLRSDLPSKQDIELGNQTYWRLYTEVSENLNVIESEYFSLLAKTMAMKKELQSQIDSLKARK